jgi:hypothetical protein
LFFLFSSSTCSRLSSVFIVRPVVFFFETCRLRTQLMRTWFVL